jgi:large subunit ribosomal protein L19
VNPHFLKILKNITKSALFNFIYLFKIKLDFLFLFYDKVVINVNIIKMSIKKQELLSKLESNYLKSNLPNFFIGDTVKLGLKIQEGEKTRIQNYEGVIISKKNIGLNKIITVRRIFQGVGIERCFLIHSPKIQSIEIIRSSKVRRAKLYYLRNLYGKATRLKQSVN